MPRKLLWLLIGLVSLLVCSRTGPFVVDWKPQHPKAGEKITITFKPQRLTRSGKQELKIFMVYQLLTEQEVETHRVPLECNKNSYRITIPTKLQTLIVRFKFEDQLDRVEDNHGRGWNILIRDKNGNIPRNSHYKLGLFLCQEATPEYVPDYAQGYQEFKQELSLFPDNYQAWFEIWNTRLKETNRSPLQLARVKSQFDSIMAHTPENGELAALAFNVYLKLLDDRASAIRLGERFLTTYPDAPYRDDVEYLLIFLKHHSNQNAITTELAQFVRQSPHRDYRKKGYYHLGMSFQEAQDNDKAINFFQNYLELEPNDVQILLNLAKLYLKKRDYLRAQTMIDRAQANCTEENFLQTHPWQEPAQRQAWLKLDQCQILSTQAELETEMKNFPAAIHKRRQVIELGTPFPAFEWVKIGDIYFQLGKLDSAEHAYIKAVSINSVQEDAINKLLLIYQLNQHRLTDFNNYLQNAVQEELKASAKLAPDFILTDLEGNGMRLSDQKGNIILLTFWDSWSTACIQEIPQLNNLIKEFKENPAVLFWAISVEAPVSINKFLSKTPMNYKHLHSGYEVKKLFNVIGFPTHVVIDRMGKIRFTHIGYAPEIGRQLKKEIEFLLQEEKIIS